MALFTYKAIDSRGRAQTGKLDAANESDLEQRLTRMGMDLVRCRFIQDRRMGATSRRIRRIDLMNFCFHMEQLTRSGVSLIEGLEDLRDSVEQASFRAVIARVIEDIESGMKMSEALAEHPHAFDEMFVNLIAAGETSGQLPDIFHSLNEMLKWQDELIATTKKLMIFPIIVGLAIFFVVGFMMIYLVPQLTSFIEGIGSTLPTHTRLLIATSDFFVNFWYVFTIGPIALLLMIRVLAATSKDFRYQLDALKLKLWQIGPVLKKIILSRFANLFAMMYRAGIPVLDCIEITEKTTNNTAIQSALSRARADIQDGYGVSTSFRNTGLFPPLVVRMIKIGETTGDLDQALLNVSYFYDRDIRDSIEKVQALIQPVMTVILGGILGWVMISIMGPVYDSITDLPL